MMVFPRTASTAWSNLSAVTTATWTKIIYIKNASDKGLLGFVQRNATGGFDVCVFDPEIFVTYVKRKREDRALLVAMLLESTYLSTCCVCN